MDKDLLRIKEIILQAQKKNLDLTKPIKLQSSFLDHKDRELHHSISLLSSLINKLSDDHKIRKLYNKKDFFSIIKEIDSLPRTQETIREISFELKSHKLPIEIKEEIEADFEELKKCYNSSLYRSAVILCGRILETCLHKKYFEITGNDALEKSPGIGLGNLVAKLVEKGVNFDPGTTQQIHLINQVRIFSVHKKIIPFYPSKAQTQAIILFTLDILNKLF